MPNLFALQWNADRAHLVEATTKGNDVVVQRVATLSATDDHSVREQVVARIGEWRLGKGATTLVAVGRDSCELRVLDVPPVPADELPDIVRFQSMQQFSSFGDDWPVDFVPITTEPVDTVLAATIQPQVIREIQNVCEDAGVTLTGAILRPCGTAMVVDRASPARNGNYTLIVDIVGNKADLIVARKSSVLMSRSLKLPKHDERGDVADVSTLLLAEVRRTIASQKTQFADATVDRIVICGDDEQNVAFRDLLRERLKMPAECIAPFSGFSLSRKLRGDLPENASSYAPLLGLLLEETTTERHAIDFVRPRRPAPPKDTRTFWTGMATLVLLVGFLAAVAWWWALGNRDAQLAQLRKDIRDADESVKKVQKLQRQVDDIDEWYRKSPNWLHEFNYVSQKLPPPEKLRLERLNADMTAAGGRINIKGYVDKAQTVTDIENRLKDHQHQLSGVGRSETKDDPKYPWYFNESVMIDPLKEPPVKKPDEAAAPAPAENKPDQVEPSGNGEAQQ